MFNRFKAEFMKQQKIDFFKRIGQDRLSQFKEGIRKLNKWVILDDKDFAAILSALETAAFETILLFGQVKTTTLMDDPNDAELVDISFETAAKDIYQKALADDLKKNLNIVLSTGTDRHQQQNLNEQLAKKIGELEKKLDVNIPTPIAPLKRMVSARVTTLSA